MSETAAAPGADYFDGWYADMASSRAVDEIHLRHLGLCVDAIQFAAPPAAAYRELRRIPAPGGRAVLTGWEAVDRPGWRDNERAMWEAAALDPGGDRALQSLHDEGVRTLVVFDLIRRVMATATALRRKSAA